MKTYKEIVEAMSIANSRIRHIRDSQEPDFIQVYPRDYDDQKILDETWLKGYIELAAYEAAEKSHATRFYLDFCLYQSAQDDEQAIKGELLTILERGGF